MITLPSPRVLVAAAITAGLTVAVLAPAGAASAAVADSPGVVTSAAALIDSVGINVHTYYNDTAYADTARVVSLLQGLGVRHVRDGLAANRPDEVAALQQLAGAGIRSSLILGNTTNSATQTVDPSQLSELQQLAPGVDAVEPTNEYDCSGDPSWAAHQHAYAQTLVNSLQSDATLRQLGIFAPAFCTPTSVAAYGSVTGSASVTNAHDYAGGQAPELALESRLPSFSSTQQSALPMAVTETGYQNALNSGANAVTESTAADYTVRALLDDSRLGIARTYLYELLDEKPDAGLTNPEEHFGLVRADGTVKPAYTAVANLLSDVAQGSPSSVTGGGSASAAPVTLSGGGSLLRSLTATDPNGGGQTTALWLAVPVENTATHTQLPDVTRTVHLSTTSTFAATTRRPSRDNASVALGTGTAFDVPVSGAVTLVHLAPASGTATAACTSRPGYSALATQLGATAASDLAPSTGWSGSPATPSSLPGGVTTGAEITAGGQQRHLAVPGSPTSWTIAVWERTSTTAAAFSSFLQVTGASGALMRTYDLADDVPSHVQLSAYGLPASGAGYGTETFGQATPGTWHLLSLTNSGSGATFSVDGVAAGTVASSAGALSGLDVGSLSSGFRGSLAGLEVFPTTLNADQLSQLATTAPVTCAGGGTAAANTTSSTTSTATAPSTSGSTTSTPPAQPKKYSLGLPLSLVTTA